MKRIVSMLFLVCMCLSVSVMLTACGEEHEHTYKTEWSKDATHHWHTCEGEDCTDIADKAEHTWDDGVITTEATADADGVKTFTCTACGQTETEALKYTVKTTVAKEEWLTLINTLYDSNLYIVMSDGTYESSVTVTADSVKRQDTIGDVSVTEYYVNENGLAFVYKYENNTWYKQPYMTDDDWSQGVIGGFVHYTWERVHYRNTDGIIDDMLPISLLNYDLFSYNEEVNAYYCECIEITYDFTDSSDYLRNIYISFENDKLLEIQYEFCDDTEGNPIYNCSFSCAGDELIISLPDENTVISLPTDYSQTEGVDTTINAEFDWQMAIIAFQKNNKIHFESGNKQITILNDKIKFADGSDTTYYANENGTSYIYEYDVNAWIKYAEGSDEDKEIAAFSWQDRLDMSIMECFDSLIMPGIFWSYDLFEYNETEKTYCLAEYESHEGFLYRNISFYFENGKLINLTFDYCKEGAWHSVDLSVADSNSISLPTVIS